MTFSLQFHHFWSCKEPPSLCSCCGSNPFFVLQLTFGRFKAGEESGRSHSHRMLCLSQQSVLPSPFVPVLPLSPPATAAISVSVIHNRRRYNEFPATFLCARASEPQTGAEYEFSSAAGARSPGPSPFITKRQSSVNYNMVAEVKRRVGSILMGSFPAFFVVVLSWWRTCNFRFPTQNMSF